MSAHTLFICENCGKQFLIRNGKVKYFAKTNRKPRFCCRKCASEDRRIHPYTLTCETCGKEYPFPSHRHATRFCCDACIPTKTPSQQHMKKMRGARKPREKYPCTLIFEFTCKVCGKKAYKPRGSRSCCSEKCRNKLHSDRCKETPGMCRCNSQHAGWYISPTAGKVWLESSWEFLCAQVLDQNLITWSRPKDGFLWIDLQGKDHKYYPDFYIPDRDLYLDPKNSYRQRLDKLKIDTVRKMHNINLLILNKEDLREDRLLQIIDH